MVGSRRGKEREVLDGHDMVLVVWVLEWQRHKEEGEKEEGVMPVGGTRPGCVHGAIVMGSCGVQWRVRVVKAMAVSAEVVYGGDVAAGAAIGSHR